ncbi:Two-component response regulator ARR18 [Apostasia shenzhenica]|uniref:Two-component response regulator ARR18 n=1 Tax=Apostasia shenzhenica TaxID=1088818 RepID=A0A2I0B9R7_9ASPA|nr:Two-component response regulator ARR18 [Apostasia shenzhenica]
MASPSELSLDFKPNSYSMIQKAFSEQADQQTQKLQEFLSRLEEERFKIEAFKRELPLCMQLLNNAVESYRVQLEEYRKRRGTEPMLEEFIPLKNMSIEEMEKPANPTVEKASWMVSAQLWSSPAADSATAARQPPPPAAALPALKESVEHCFGLDSKPRNGGAFHPFCKEKNKDSPPPSSVHPELALASPDNEMNDKKCPENESGARGSRTRESCSKNVTMAVDHHQQAASGKGGNGVAADGAQPATQRKARRCWSPDLHRRFVNALQILGGSQATPKQIRELMKVDGLTNDEVKSHLQKYRLHTRRPMAVAPAAAAAAPQLVVLGGIWVPPEYATSAAAAAAAAAAAGPALYGAHPTPAHYCPSPPAPHDYYQTPLPPTMSPVGAQLHGHLPPLQLGGGTVNSGRYKSRKGSPESELRSSGERSESIEEGQEEESEVEADVEEEKAEEKGMVARGGAKVEDGAVELKF